MPSSEAEAGSKAKRLLRERSKKIVSPISATPLDSSDVDAWRGVPYDDSRNFYPMPKPTLEFIAEMVSDFSRLLLRSVDGVTYKTEGQGSYKLALLYFLLRAKQNLDAVIALCRAGFTVQAMMVARSTFEMCITIEYISKEIEKRAKLYADYDAVERHSWLKKAEKFRTQAPELLAGASPKTQERIRRNYSKVKHQFPEPYRWAGKGMTLAEMCRKLKADQSYEIQYGFLCQFTHNSVVCSNDHFEEGKNGALTLKDGPNSKYRVPALATAAINTLHIASYFNDGFELKRDKEHDALLELFKGA